MKGIRIEEKKKVIGLVALSIAFFALTGWRAKSLADGPTNAPQAGAVNIVIGTPPAAQKAPEKPIILPAATKQPANDPFFTSDKGGTAQSGISPNPDEKPSVETEPYTPLKGDFAPMPSPLETTPAPKPAPEIVESITVKGVVICDQSSAILHVGNQDLVVATGSTFGNGYKLVSATETQVVIQKGKKQQTLLVSG